MKHWKTIALCALTGLITALLAAQAQVPGVNSTLNTVFTYVYEASTNKPTYAATVRSIPQLSTTGAAVSAPTDDVCTITGSATKTVRVRRVIVSGVTGTASTDPLSILFRTTLNSGGSGVFGAGGTRGPATITSYDTNNGAATAIVEGYNAWDNTFANGTLAGELLETNLVWGSIAGTTAQYLQYVFGERGSAGILRSATQQITVNIGATLPTTGAGVTTANIVCTFEWTEDTVGN